jgi:hypothetical protein
MSISFIGGHSYNIELALDESELDLAENDVLFAFLHGSILDPPDPPAGWVEVADSPLESTSFAGNTLWGYHKILGPSETGLYDFDAGGSFGWYIATALYRGVKVSASIAEMSSAENGNATPILFLPSVDTITGNSRLVAATANQIHVKPSVAGFAERVVDGVGTFIFDKNQASAGASGIVEVVSANEFGTGFDLGFLIALTPEVGPGARFDCANIDSQIN